MDRSLLPHLPAVLAVARRRSFAGAAAELGIGPSAVSHAIRCVEERLQTPLFRRTTRSVGLTEAGTALVETIGRAFTEVEDALDRVKTDQGRITGVLRLNASRVALSIALTPILGELACRHPDLTVEVTSDDALVDIVGGGFDAGVRLGEMIAQDMVAVRLTPAFRAIMVASPGYLAAKGTPGSIQQLSQHNCIGFRLLATQRSYAWELHDRGKDVAVSVTGTVLVTDATYARDLAVAGVGIAYVFEPLVETDMRERRLCQILPRTAIQEPGLFVYFPRRSARMPKLRAFLDIAQEVARRPPHRHTTGTC